MVRPTFGTVSLQDCAGNLAWRANRPMTSHDKGPGLEAQRRVQSSQVYAVGAIATVSLGPDCGQAARPISTGKLSRSPRLHSRPINLVVSEGSLVRPEGRRGYLISREASRLYAFSAYPFRTWLPSDAPGGTAGTPEVRPSRSSRTKDGSSQVSCAHTR
jgi:hypothetical protein